MSWAVLTTRPRGEAAAARQMTRAGAETYAPLCRRTPRSSPELLLPGYILTPWRPSWSGLVGDAVTGALGAREGCGAEIVGDDVIAELRGRADDDGVILLPDDMALGSRVDVVRGVFAGSVGRVVGVGERIRVLLELMGRRVGIDMHRADLALA